MDIICEDTDEWEFHEDDNINIFTYLSLFGSGEFSFNLVHSITFYLSVLTILFIHTTRDHSASICAWGSTFNSNHFV